MAVVEEPPGRGVEPGSARLWLGIVVYRWVTIGWMVVLAVLSRQDLRRPLLAATAIVATVAWNAWGRRRRTLRSGWSASATA